MQCKNHPDVMAVDRCAGCAEPFCANCLVDIQGRNYCGSCKVMAVQGPPVVPQATMSCKEAIAALVCSLVGLLCFGIILEPIAIALALIAKKKIRLNPNLTGSGMATAGLVIGIIVTVLWVIGIIVQISRISAQ